MELYRCPVRQRASGGNKARLPALRLRPAAGAPARSPDPLPRHARARPQARTSAGGRCDRTRSRRHERSGRERHRQRDGGARGGWKVQLPARGQREFQRHRRVPRGQSGGWPLHRLCAPQRARAHLHRGLGGQPDHARRQLLSRPARRRPIQHHEDRRGQRIARRIHHGSGSGGSRARHRQPCHSLAAPLGSP